MAHAGRHAYPRRVSRFGLGVALLTPACTLACLVAGACLPGGGPPLIDGDDAGGGTGIDLAGDSGLQRTDVDLGDPFALYGLDPSHGPYTGGTSARLTGRGFTSKLRVFIGGQEVGAIAGDPTRALVETPPGKPGWVDVMIRDDATAKERVLQKGFFYDSFVVTPDSGATSGGTRIRLTNAGTPWTAPVKICDRRRRLHGRRGHLEHRRRVHDSAGRSGLEGRHGARAFRNEDPGARCLRLQRLDGRLSRRALRRRVLWARPRARVRRRHGDGDPRRVRRCRQLGAHGGIVKQTSTSGVAEINGLTGTKVTVTVAAKCHQPITYVDVPVDTVTVYLAPVLDIACLPPSLPDPPSTGGNGGKYGGVIEGELVFPGGSEFEPHRLDDGARADEADRASRGLRVRGSDFSSTAFQLPSPSEAITPDTEGANGYKFSLVAYPGNVTLYIVAGLEDRSETPPRFVPYSMGVARGISVPAQTRVTGVDVQHGHPLRSRRHGGAAAARPRTSRAGPDRHDVRPHARRIAATPCFRATCSSLPCPRPPPCPSSGVPSLDHAIAGEQYVLGGVAATGADLQQPASVISRIRTTNANDPVVVGGFLNVPVLGQPGSGSWGGAHVQYSGTTGFDLQVVQIESGNGLVSWVIAGPGGTTSFDVPDLRALPGPDALGLVGGAIKTTVHVGRIDGFSYGKMRQGQLSLGLVERARVRLAGRRLLTGSTVMAAPRGHAQSSVGRLRAPFVLAALVVLAASCQFDPAYRDIPDPGAARRAPRASSSARGASLTRCDAGKRVTLDDCGARGLVCAPGLLRCTACLPASASCDGFDVLTLRRRRPDAHEGRDLRRREGHRVSSGRLQEPLRDGRARALERRLRVLGGRPRQRGHLAGQRRGAAVRRRRVERRAGPRRDGHRRRGHAQASGRPSSVRTVATARVGPRSLEVFKLGPKEVDGSAPGTFDTGTHTALTRGAYPRSLRRADRRLPVQPARERQRVLERRVAAAPDARARWRQRPLLRRRGLAADDRDEREPRAELRHRPARVPRDRRDAGRTRRCTSSRRRASSAAGPSPAASSQDGEFDVTLQPFEVLNLETGDFNADFTGTLIDASGAGRRSRRERGERRALLLDDREPLVLRRPPRGAGDPASRRGQALRARARAEPVTGARRSRRGDLAVRRARVLPGRRDDGRGSRRSRRRLPAPYDVIDLDGEGANVTIIAHQDFVHDGVAARARRGRAGEPGGGGRRARAAGRRPEPHVRPAGRAMAERVRPAHAGQVRVRLPGASPRRSARRSSSTGCSSTGRSARWLPPTASTRRRARRRTRRSSCIAASSRSRRSTRTSRRR